MRVNYTVVASTKDVASLSILNAVSLRYPEIPTEVIEEELVFCDKEIFERFSGIIFASRHESLSLMPSLLVHAPGNWGEVFHGGRKGGLCPTDARLMRRIAMALSARAANTHYQVMQECTHHGPFVEKTAIFLEIGSDEKEWTNEAAAGIIADSLHQALSVDDSAVNAIGIGGPHYAPAFNKLLAKGYAFGHICPKYALKDLNKDTLMQAMAKSQADIAILDWKGLGSEKQRIISLLEETGIKYLKNSEI